MESCVDLSNSRTSCRKVCWNGFCDISCGILHFFQCIASSSCLLHDDVHPLIDLRPCCHDACACCRNWSRHILCERTSNLSGGIAEVLNLLGVIFQCRSTAFQLLIYIFKSALVVIQRCFCIIQLLPCFGDSSFVSHLCILLCFQDFCQPIDFLRIRFCLIL